MSYLVQLTYFKDSGKYYSHGEYRSKKTELFEIFDEVKEMVELGALPGLMQPATAFITLIKSDHPHDHPYLVIPSRVVAR